MKFVIAYKLASGVSREQFRAFSQNIDVPTLLSLSGFRSVEANYVERGDAQDAVPFDVIETIEVDRYEDWAAGMSTDAAKALAEKFGQVANVDSLVVLPTTPL